MASATVAELWRYPVKSLQGLSVDALDVSGAGVVHDRRWALLDLGSGRVLSAKRTPDLLDASTDGEHLTLPDGTTVDVEDPVVHDVLTAWIGRPVVLHAAEGTEGLTYEMTFDPPDDAAEAFEIPIPAGTFVDLAPVHVVATATLRGCAAARPDLDWDVRRFRPNVVVDVAGEPFLEDGWVGREVCLGEVVLSVQQPTVRCAMPLRAQPAHDGRAALDRQAELYAAMTELHVRAPNHLGVYAEVVQPGAVALGDPVEVR